MNQPDNEMMNEPGRRLPNKSMNSMSKQPIYVAFSTQKGGVGKSAFTVLAASYLHYLKDYRVAVLDCDFPQHSLFEMRKRDSELILQNESYKRQAYEQFTRLGRKAYPVVKCRVEEALQKAEELTGNTEEQPDILFFDLPGTVNSTGVLKVIAAMDYIFSPVSADRMILKSTLSFMDITNRMLIGTAGCRIKGLYLYWNLVDGREKSDLYATYEKVIAEMKLNLLRTFIPDTKRFRKELSENGQAAFRSTMFPADKRLLKGSHLEELLEEIVNIINR